MLLIKNGWIITCDDKGTDYRKGNIVVEGSYIKEITEKEIANSDAFDQVIDAEGKIVIPGLVNGHIHSYANFTKGLHENVPLEMWMLYIMSQGICMEPEDIYYNALLGCIEMLKSGTTSCVDHLAQGYEGLEAAIKAYEDTGMRAAIAPMITDKLYYQTIPVDENSIPEEFKSGQPKKPQELIDTTLKLLKNWNGKYGRLKVMFGPSGPQRCSDVLLMECAKLADEYDTGVHTHVLESRYQAEIGEKMYGKPMVLHLSDIGFLSERTSLVHSVWLSDMEAKEAAECGATVVHNPASNLILGSGSAPVNLYRELGLTVSIGTDGANCGGNLNMFESMRLAASLHKGPHIKPQKWTTAEEVLRMATRNSSRVALTQNEVGSLEAGKKADIIIINPRKSTAMIPLNDPVCQMVYSESGSGVETVLVDGKVVLEQGKVVGIDEDKVYSEAEKRSQRIMEKALTYKDKNDRFASIIKNALY